MPRPGRPTTERAKDFKGTLRQLLAAMSRYKLSLIVVVVFAILSTIFNIAGPKILAKATTALATGWIAKLRGVGSIDFAYIGRVLLFLFRQFHKRSFFPGPAAGPFSISIIKRQNPFGKSSAFVYNYRATATMLNCISQICCLNVALIS